ncbi:hypothetical protein ANN_17577 [Periplaneta americana]|uniref:DUF659 domain-containing protein n=1 Tax=Periplaneta americana TaxID=6978 RepID=A0ABQ8SU98_PERAM|nr:hypothetical protein ANN_17577 [Periplaneta americana]
MRRQITVGRHVVSVVVGAMDARGPNGPYLLTCEIVDVVNYSSICTVFENAMKLLWPSGVKSENVFLFVTDAAPYMINASNYLKLNFPNLIHVTCLAHARHRTAEVIRRQFPGIDELIGAAKKIFVKAPARVKAFKKICPGVSLPPSAILTRWVSWLKACSYYCKFFDQVQNVIQSFDVD